ncbi:Rossman fold protein, TIGR00730 family [Candidatus Kaiserbacteria bacterium RIFCSPLOWO2_01_FULL_54_24]|uniref:Cytokinin riboside 5'-monophosphate phosphoribohydrolase n=1 Tax=Candidatus Kaiserbacteria bacterium RIFCSPLOWO2_01_FULL_54_24 TaxID=1798515 RepID=A0A1F6ETJ7_9BACT|nr:MAG: Rossman fold protein, TIGR00730 family [Candidatus Kaiserbacteria bacterium RIFCSPLOWO2_01_FULL_54_24]
MIKRICVYCGSGPGTNPAFVAAARQFGKILVLNGIELVWGAGKYGIMGEIARSVLQNGGSATGVIPEFLIRKEGTLEGTTHLIVTKDMHERKQKFWELSDAFVALPGGVGTLEETVEQMTWIQIGRSKKSMLLANIEGFWDPLICLLEHMRRLEFIRPGLEFNQLVANQVDEILPILNGTLVSKRPGMNGNGHLAAELGRHF